MIDDTGSVEGIYALHTAQRGDLVRSLKDRATQLPTNTRVELFVMQYQCKHTRITLGSLLEQSWHDQIILHRK